MRRHIGSVRDYNYHNSCLRHSSGAPPIILPLLHQYTKFIYKCLLLTALNDQRSKKEKSDIVNEFFARLEKEILLSHKDYMASFWSAFIIIEKAF